MAKEIQTVLLNDLQLATLKSLTRRATDGIIAGDVAAEYKQNVVNALVRHGVLQTYRTKNYRMLNVMVARKPDHIKRMPKINAIECVAA